MKERGFDAGELGPSPVSLSPGRLDILSQQSTEMSLSPSLYRQLHRGTVTSPLDGKKFVPLDVVKKAINESNVASELHLTKAAGKKGTRSKAGADLATRVTTEAKILFAILVLMEKVDALSGLLDEERLTDKHLPLSRSQEHEALESCDGTYTFPFTGWSNASSDNFIETTQWLLLAPVLDISGKVINVHKDCPLPFTTSSVIGGGASGIVHRADVHPAHQRAFEVGMPSCDSSLLVTES